MSWRWSIYGNYLLTPPLFSPIVRASPILAASHAGLAPASIRCAEVDPLVDEGVAYHEKLSAAGTPSKIKIYKGQGHPFGQWGGENPAAREFTEDCVNDLKEAFAKRR